MDVVTSMHQISGVIRYCTGSRHVSGRYGLKWRLGVIMTLENRREGHRNEIIAEEVLNAIHLPRCGRSTDMDLQDCCTFHNLCLFSPLAIFLNSSCGTPFLNLSKPANTSATP